ncbi:hypothetical protein [Desulfoluna spongiiphila]|nr:hypothetical protein [Desulfoluna spongiiphila]
MMAKHRHGKDIYRRGYGNMRTPIKHNIAAKFRPVQSSYLEMFILDKHRSRLRQERANLLRRIHEIEAELSCLDAKILEMRDGVEEEMDQMSDEPAAPGGETGIRTIPLGY